MDYFLSLLKLSLRALNKAGLRAYVVVIAASSEGATELYWHFVDGIWVVLYAILYLI